MKPHGTLGPGLCQVWTHRDLASHSRPHCDSSVDTPIPGPGSLRSHVPRIHNTVSGGGASHAGLPEATCTVQSPKPPPTPTQRPGSTPKGPGLLQVQQPQRKCPSRVTQPSPRGTLSEVPMRDAKDLLDIWTSGHTPGRYSELFLVNPNF